MKLYPKCKKEFKVYNGPGKTDIINEEFNKDEANRIYNILSKFFGKVEMQKDKLGVFYSKFIMLNQDDLTKATLEIMKGINE